MRKAFIAVSVAVTLILPVSAFAEDSTSSGTANTTSSASPSAKPNLQQQRSEALQSYKQSREAARTNYLEKLRQAKTEWQTKRTELKTELKEIKDERKKQVVENLNDKISERNAAWVEHWNNVLKRLSDILDKIDKRTTEAETTGKDVTSVKTAITSAKTVITAAQAKIDAQAGKVYTINITDESTLGSAVSSVIQQFHTDVKVVIDSINEARRAVVSVFSQIKSVVGETKSPSPTPTASASPQP